MSGPITFNYFDEVARVGSGMLDLLADQPGSDVQLYLGNVADIYKLLAEMHMLVSTIVIEASVVDDVDDMRHVLRKLDNVTLSQVFNLKRWCDDLQRLGRTLRPLGDDISASPSDRDIWIDFCTTFEERESEVALLYDVSLYELRWLVDSGEPIERLHARIAEISEQLIVQKARFEMVAEKSAAIRRRLQ